MKTPWRSTIANIIIPSLKTHLCFLLTKSIGCSCHSSPMRNFYLVVNFYMRQGFFPQELMVWVMWQKKKGKNEFSSKWLIILLYLIINFPILSILKADTTHSNYTKWTRRQGLHSGVFQRKHSSRFDKCCIISIAYQSLGTCKSY